jgi:hypothetical protein
VSSNPGNDFTSVSMIFELNYLFVPTLSYVLFFMFLLITLYLWSGIELSHLAIMAWSGIGIASGTSKFIF